MIRLAGVTKRFGAATVLDDVSVEIADGEFVCLLGPSGCGKTTLLRCLAGFEEPDAGEIDLDGRSLRGVPAYRRPLNMMFQNYALFPHMSVAGNVAYGLRFGPTARRARAERVREMMRLARLEGLESRFPAQLSGGQRQRVALARALARAPRVLLLDEPLAALDRALREETRAELKSLQARLGTTFVMVTHDQDEALGLADRIGVMEAGRLVQVGPPREVYGRPRSRFVARFLGDANLLDGTVAGRDGPLALIRLTGGGEIRADASDLPPGARVAVAVRPERVGIRAGPDAGPGLAGVVAEVAFAGAANLYRVARPDGTVVRASGPGAGGALLVSPGDAVRLVILPDAAVVLP